MNIPIRVHVVNCYHAVFNIKFALVSALVNGPIALWVNHAHGTRAMIWAGLAQAAASFLSTGITARIIQHFSPIKDPFRAYFLGTVASTSLSFILSATAHLWNGTPELVQSCITPTAISFVTGFGTNFLTRHGYMLPGNYPRHRP